MEASDSFAAMRERPTDPDAGDVEDQRLFASVHARLFGGDATLRAGRYELLRSLGAGAMGEVWLAHDEALERNVAIKFVHARLVDARWAERLRREARMLARLNHPNVVHVYEVGEHDGRVYLVMEHVQGESLARWLERTKPGWAQVLAAYLEAGRGLAAAHGAGVIHRDFKPDNVLRGDDGRIVVADFGLAYTGWLEETELEHRVAEERTSEPVLSRTGEIKGTPAYMAPEQLEGGRIGARADQFAWCVSLYEGLWGRRPFPDASRAVSLAALARSPLRAPQDRGVPPWIWPIVQRGLAYAPEDRWPDMSALLAALVEVPARQRRHRRWIGTGVSLALAGLVGSAAPRWGSQPAEPAEVDACGWTQRELEGVWDELARGRLQAALGAVQASWAEDTAERVTGTLDGWADAWLSARRELCQASEGVEVADPMLSSRAACLEGQRIEVGALVSALDRADETALLAAAGAVDGLADPQVCSTQAWGEGEPPPPSSEAREAVDELAAALAAVDASIRLASFDDALRRLGELQPRLADTGYAPLQARATYHRGRAQIGLGMQAQGLATLEDATDLAEGARDDRLAASSWRTLASFGVIKARDAVRGALWLRRAEAWRTRLGDAGEAGELLVIRGHLLLLRNEAAQADGVFRAAIADLEARGERERLVDARSGLGLALVTQGRLDDALEVYREAERESERLFGPHHPEHADYVYAVGATLFNIGLAEEAERQLGRAVQIWTEGYREGHPNLGRAHLLLAQFAVEKHDLALAERHIDVAARTYRATLPADSEEFGDVATARAIVAHARGDYEAALGAIDEAVRIYARAWGESDVYVAKTHGSRGGILLSLGRVDEAEQAFLRADAVLQPGSGTAQMREPTLLGLAVVALARGKNEVALRWLAQIETAGRPDEELAQLSLWKAIALARRGKRPEAAAAFAKAGPALPEARRAGWLRLVRARDTELARLR